MAAALVGRETGIHLGFDRRHLRRDAESHLHSKPRRVEAAGKTAKQLERLLGLDRPAGDGGNPRVSQLHRYRRCDWKSRRVVDAVGQTLRGWARTALGLDQSLRPRAQCMGYRRHSSPGFQILKRWKEAADDARGTR